jgi:hypothetical protein
LCSCINTLQKIFNEIQWVERLAEHQPETQHCICDMVILQSPHMLRLPGAHMTYLLTKDDIIQTVDLASSWVILTLYLQFSHIP